MIAQEIFAKRDKRGAKQSTHLICNSTEGPKYTAAINWKLPVVEVKWLLACLKAKLWVSERPFLVGSATEVTPGKPEPKDLEIAENPPPEADIDDDDDDEIVITTGRKKVEAVEKADENKIVIKNKFFDTVLTPKNDPKRRLTIETPEIDMEKIKPRPFEAPSPSKWAAGSEPSFSGGTQTQKSSASKRRRTDFEDDYYLRGVSTPDTPYGAFLVGPNPSPRTRKFFKKQCQELGKFQLPDEELVAERLKMEKNIADKSMTETKNNQSFEHFEGIKVPTPVREKWKDNLEAKGLVVLDRDKRRFSDIMEEKANKLGRSWKHPGRKIKLVNNKSFSGQNSQDDEDGPLSGIYKKSRKKTSNI
jgi:hypothetical protein